MYQFIFLLLNIDLITGKFSTFYQTMLEFLVSFRVDLYFVKVKIHKRYAL